MLQMLRLVLKLMLKLMLKLAADFSRRSHIYKVYDVYVLEGFDGMASFKGMRCRLLKIRPSYRKSQAERGRHHPSFAWQLR